MDDHQRAHGGWWFGGGLLAVFFFLFYAFAILVGDLNQDEGWYLYAGRLTYEGLHPFRDFASTQGPVMAYVYALAYPLTRMFGVAGGRLFTAILGFLSLVSAALLAYRMASDGGNRSAGRLAALLTAGLLGLNLYHVYFTSLVKTYALAGLLVLLGFLFLGGALRFAGQMSEVRRRSSTVFMLSATAAGLFALAAGTRLSAGMLLPAVWLALAVTGRRRGKQFHPGILFVLGGMILGGTLVLAAVYLPFLLTVPEAVSFGLLEYHAGREVGGLLVRLIYKAGFLLRLSGSYFPLLVLGAFALGCADVAVGSGSENDQTPWSIRCLRAALFCGVLAVTLVHFAAPFPYDDYQVFIMPCVVLLLTVPIARQLVCFPWKKNRAIAVAAGVLLLAMVHSASSPLLQGWVTSGRDRIWWPLRAETPLQGLRQAASAVQQVSADGPLLTQDTYLAVEADLRVPRGMELGPFCFFPALDNETARRYHVLNESLFKALIANGDVPVAAFSDYGMAIRSPAIQPLDPEARDRLEQVLSSHYAPLYQFKDFGQAETVLRVYQRRSEP